MSGHARRSAPRREARWGWTMRKAVLLSLGLGVTLVAAVFVGAAAASTGAPVFYDARYPVPASSIPGEYEAGNGVVVEPGTDGSIDEADAEGEPIPTPPVSDSDHAPDGAPPTAKPPAQPPGVLTPTPTPTPEPGEPGDGGHGDDEPGDHPDGEGHDGADPDGDGPGEGRTDGTTSDAPRPPHAGGDDIGRDTTEPSAAEQQDWLAFQEVVRDCMAGAGHEYLYWEWWNPGSDSSNRFPAMPSGLSSGEAQAWELALHGTSPLGDAYRWEDAGCWGYAAHVSGNTH
ncbi:MAG: hypothetical protein M3Y52_10640 [Actinomycetota bacterium]|nr:hypothetical protein [Actinomycetota bacterium]